MKLFFYDTQKGHKRADTERMIKSALDEYISKEHLIPFDGVIKRTRLGKPYIDYPLFIGVTHTDTSLIIAVSQNGIGIDCESADRKVMRYESIMKKYFCENEIKAVKDSSCPHTAFLDTWVKKEAYVKYTGEGISAMSRYDTTLLQGFQKVQNDRNLIIYIYKEQKHE